VSGNRPRESGRRATAGEPRGAACALEKRLEVRIGLLTAMCLRRFGEHEAAALLMENPNEFERLDQAHRHRASVGPGAPA
jgi:hypothetical protein